MIGVTLVAVELYEAVLERGGKRAAHRVRMSRDCYLKLSGGAFTHEWVVAQALQFLLEREDAMELPAELDLADIGQRFPEFEGEIDRRLHRR